MLPPYLGVLAGGRGLRMGNVDKARLRAPDSGEPLLERLLRLGRDTGCECLVVGGDAPRGVVRLADEPSGIGPIGGLQALLTHAGERPALALACDMPYVSAALLRRLLQTETCALVISPRDPRTGKWQPLFARYDAPRVAPLLRAAIASGVRSFQTFLRSIEVAELELDEAERRLLRDWDEPRDLLQP